MNELKAAPASNAFCGANKTAVWTNTTGSGNQVGTQFNCGNWTGGGGGSVWGLAANKDAGWSAACSGGLCNSMAFLAPLYCVQQE